MRRSLGWLVLLLHLCLCHSSAAAQTLEDALTEKDPTRLFRLANQLAGQASQGPAGVGALEVWLRVEDSFEQLPRTSAKAFYLPYVRLQAGEYLRHAGRLGEAESRLESARAGLYGGDYARLHAGVRAGLLRLEAQVRLDQGHPDRAQPLLDRARTSLEELGDLEGSELAEWLAVRKAEVGVRIAQARYGQALQLAEQILGKDDLFTGIDQASHERSRLELLAAMAQWGLERRKEQPRGSARIRFEGLVENNEPSTAVHQQALRKLLEIALDESRYSDAVESLASLDRLGPPRTTRDWTLRATLRGRLAADGSSRQEAKLLALEDLRAAFRAWVDERQADPKARSHFNYRGPQDLLGELIRLELALQPGSIGIEQALRHVFDAQLLGTLARELEVQQATLENVRQELLGPEETLVLLVIGSQRSHVFAFDQDQLVHATTSSERGLLDELVRPFRQAVFPSSPPQGPQAKQQRAEALVQLGSGLFEALFPSPVAALVLSHQKLSFVGSDQIGYLPLAALVHKPGSLLGDDHALGFLPSVPVGLALARRDAEPAWDKDMLLLAAPVHGTEAREQFPDLQPLVLPADRLQRLTGTLLPERIQIKAGEQANLAQLQTSGARNSRVWTLFTHGAHDPGLERPSGLILAGNTDWLLTSDRVQALQSPWLTVLAACGASRGPWRRGDPDSGHLVGALTAAGGQVIVHAEVDIRLPAAVAMAEHLHSFLAEGHSTAEALRLARAALALDPAFSDLAHRCALQATGLVHRSVFPGGVSRARVSRDPAPSRLGLWALLGAAVLVAGLALRRPFRAA